MKTSRISTTAKVAILAIAGSVVGAMSASAQLVTYTPGDLVLGFRASAGTGNETNFYYNLGSTVGFRDGTTTGNLANVGSFLSATFGNDWFTRTDLSWGAVGNRNNVSPFPPNQFIAAPGVVNGDPSATVYVSKGALSAGSSTPWSGFSSPGLTTGAGSMNGMLSGGASASTGTFNKQTALVGSNGFGAYTSSAFTNSWTNRTAPSSDFGIFDGGVEGNFGTVTQLAYLDLYRILARTDQAGTVILDGNTTVGLGSYITTLSIDSLGNISAAPIPEPSAFAALAGIGALGVAALRRRRRVA